MKPNLLVSALSPAILAVSFMETPALAESFTQYFRDMPVRAGELCDDVVFTEGQRLASYAQSHLGQSVQVTRAYCKTDDVGDHLPKWNMVIEYDSDRRLPAVSTINYQDMNHAGYKNAAECQANMEVERAAFTKNTELAIFTSYCSIPLFRDFDSELTIIGFGTPAKSSFDVSFDLFGTIQGHTRDTFISMVGEGFSRLGFDAVHFSMNNHLPYFVMTARYYGSSKIRIEETNLVNLADDTSCPTIVSDVTNALNTSSTAHFGVYCMKDTSSRSKFKVAALLHDQSTLKLVTPETQYDDSAACESSRSAVIDHYRNDLRRQIIAGYCSLNGETKKFGVVLLEK